MPTISEMLVGSVLESSQKAPDIAGAVTSGAQLAGHIEEIKKSREQMEMAKENVRVQKAEKIMDAIEKGSQFKDKAAQNIYFKNHVPSMIKALKMDDVFSSDLMPYIQGSQETRDKILGLRLDIQDKINSGELRGANILNYAKSKLTPEELPMLDTESLLEQQKLATVEQNKFGRAQLVADTTTRNQQVARDQAGRVEQDKDIAKQSAIWDAGGGAAARDKTHDIFANAIKQLQNGDVQFGTAWKNIPWVGNPEKLPIADKKAKAFLDNIRGGISIREKTGDPNPTQAQIDAIMNRVIDPRLTNKQNIDKLKIELDAMDADTENKLKAFEAAGFKKSAPETKYHEGKTYRKIKDRWVEVK